MTRNLASVLIVILLLLVCITAGAQQPIRYGPPPSQVSFEASPFFVTAGLNFHGDQASFKLRRSLVRFGVSYLPWNSDFRFDYLLTTAYSTSDDIVPAGPLFIGPSNFGQDPQSSSGTSGGSSSQQQKSVTVEWSQAGGHRIQLAAYQKHSPALHPIVLGEWFDVNITGTGEVKGKQSTDSERLSKFAVAGGLECSTRLEGLENSVLVAFGSDRYSLINWNASYQLSRSLWARLAFEHKKMLLGNDTNIYFNGLMVGVKWEF